MSELEKGKPSNREKARKNAAQKFVVTLPVQNYRCIGYRIIVRTRTLPLPHRIEPIFTRWGLFLCVFFFAACLTHTARLLLVLHLVTLMQMSLRKSWTHIHPVNDNI